jgi:superfamily II DNA or RNA helicase
VRSTNLNQLSLIQDTEPTVSEQHSPHVGQNALRPYQSRILDEALSLIGLGKSPLIEMATGTGKTRLAAELVRRLPQARTLWLAERREWLEQARGSLLYLDEPIGWEAPGRYSSNERIVLASKDTIRQPDRLERLRDFRPFDLIVTDEAHHSAARTYTVVRQTYPGAVLVGLSATPDRFDKRGLDMFSARTTPYGIVQAVGDAWLVRPMAKRCKVKSVDLSGIGYRAGDFAVNELDNLFAGEETIHGCVRGILENVQSRPTIVFCPGISSAHRTAEVLDRYSGRLVSRVVTGRSSPDFRTDAFKHFGKSYQFLVNVAVATEGTDLPDAACISFLRPTHSPALFRQMLGRGLRPALSMHVDSTREEREAILRDGPKPNCLVLDFVGVTGRHSVVTVADVFSTGPAAKLVGNRIDTEADTGTAIDVFEAIRTEEEKEQAAKEAKERRRQREKDKRQAITGKVTVEVTEAALIGLGSLSVRDDQLSMRPVSPGQAQELTRLGISIGDGPRTAAYARKLILDRREQLGLMSEKQAAFLLRHGQGGPETTKAQARGLTWKLLKRWKRL